MGLKITHVDAFAEHPFQGNPAAVCILETEKSAEWMQNVAMEMGLSETAFLRKEEQGYGLRWFTPSIEVELCGHATLASAHVLWEEGLLNQDEPARFSTLSGLLLARKKGVWIELDFPVTPEEEIVPPSDLAPALGANPLYTGKSCFDYLVEVESEEVIRNLKPDLQWLADFPVRGIIVTARGSSNEYDFVSRFFAPASGIDEDPATGSAHCCLASYWSKKLGKNEFMALQASARGALIGVRLSGDRVFISGKAVTVLRGELVTE